MHRFLLIAALLLTQCTHPEPDDVVLTPSRLPPQTPGKQLMPDALHNAVIPVSRDSEPKWVEFYQRIQTEIAAQKRVDLLFLGDSITQGWRKQEDLWKRYYAARHPINGGIWSDATQHLLWRIRRGNFAGADPRVTVLMIGTNNGTNTPREIAEGVSANVDEVRRQFPRSRILVLGIFPSGEDPSGKRRTRNAAANGLIKQLADDRTIFYLDIGAALVERDGRLGAGLAPDHVHLTRAGYEIWAREMEPSLARLFALPALDEASAPGVGF